ncbi:MAG: hypothetical protein WCF57_16130 [Pyrinomonadaceae bacterium]
MTSDEIEKAYFGAFSDEFHIDLIRLIASKCRDAVEECSVYRKERANNLSPYVRRIQIEENVELLVEDYPEINCYVRRLGTNNCVTELRREVVLLTIHKVAHQNSKVRPAVQREMLATSSQANFFEPDEPPPDDAFLYAQVKYGTAKRFPDQLAFVVVDFPDKEGDLVHSINLLARLEFASLVDETRKETRTENIDDNLDLKLRSDARNKDRKGGIIGPQQESQPNTNKTEENKNNNRDKDEN